MLGQLDLRVRRFLALLVFVFGLVTAFSCVAYAQTGVAVPPLPLKKPATEDAVLQPAGLAGGLLTDFASTLLNFDAPPVPGKKPFLIQEGPLSEQDAARYRKIFTLQAAGDMKGADKEMENLTDMRLRGHVLYQRYMHPSAYKSSFEELQNWLILYADYPGADKIYALASRKGGGKIRQPQNLKQITGPGDPTSLSERSYVTSKKRSAAENADVKNFKAGIVSLVHKAQPAQAYKVLKDNKTANLLDTVEKDLLQSQIAAVYLYTGDTKKAYELARASAKRSGLNVPLAGWVAGMASWLRGDYEEAASFFEIPGRSSYASGWTASAGSYWAARAHMRTGNVRAVSIWLERATEHPRTFYGLIATRALGRDFDFNWQVPEFTREGQNLLGKVPAGQRAMALAAAGQLQLAEAELVRINTKDRDLRNAMFAYAAHAGLPGLAMRLAGNASGPAEGIYYDAALYPTGSWQPKEGYKIDPALIHAIMRQESRFDPEAESPSGAKGLMQLMPETASYVAGSRKLRSKEGQSKLLEPETNLEIGQQYLEDLLGERSVKGDLLSLLVAYNAGPGNLARWKKQWHRVDDDLAFIELIPSRETRAYVERVLANYWMYRMREGLETPTLDALAAGEPARYVENYDRRKADKLAQAPDDASMYRLAYNSN
jgi:soluble lytic murein transglycosylase-like protein